MPKRARPRTETRQRRRREDRRFEVRGPSGRMATLLHPRGRSMLLVTNPETAFRGPYVGNPNAQPDLQSFG
jgi:hypothetical protein